MPPNNSGTSHKTFSLDFNLPGTTKNEKARINRAFQFKSFRQKHGGFRSAVLNSFTQQFFNLTSLVAGVCNALDKKNEFAF
jgi:hypothetical protein